MAEEKSISESVEIVGNVWVKTPIMRGLGVDLRFLGREIAIQKAV